MLGAWAAWRGLPYYWSAPSYVSRTGRNDCRRPRCAPTVAEFAPMVGDGRRDRARGASASDRSKAAVKSDGSSILQRRPRIFLAQGPPRAWLHAEPRFGGWSGSTRGLVHATAGLLITPCSKPVGPPQRPPAA